MRIIAGKMEPEIALNQKATPVIENISNKVSEQKLDKTGMSAIDWTIYPNPLTENSTIAFSVNQATNVIIDILDMQGKVIKNITSQEYNQGFYTINFPSIGLVQETYLCRIRQGNQTSVKKIISK